MQNLVRGRGGRRSRPTAANKQQQRQLREVEPATTSTNTRDLSSHHHHHQEGWPMMTTADTYDVVDGSTNPKANKRVRMDISNGTPKKNARVSDDAAFFPSLAPRIGGAVADDPHHQGGVEHSSLSNASMPSLGDHILSPRKGDSRERSNSGVSSSSKSSFVPFRHATTPNDSAAVGATGGGSSGSRGNRKKEEKYPAPTFVPLFPSEASFSMPPLELLQSGEDSR